MPDIDDVQCWECGGTGTDPGSLNEPEPCAICYGTGSAPVADELADAPEIGRVA